MANAGAAISPTEWEARVAGSPDLCSARAHWNGALLRRWHGRRRAWRQPPLDHHYLVLHLGGPKKVHRHGLHSVTSAGPRGRRRHPRDRGHQQVPGVTKGPIDFAHLYHASALVRPRCSMRRIRPRLPLGRTDRLCRSAASSAERDNERNAGPAREPDVRITPGSRHAAAQPDRWACIRMFDAFGGKRVRSPIRFRRGVSAGLDSSSPITVPISNSPISLR
jgi:hypothetical protein